jgi:aminopeptidase N
VILSSEGRITELAILQEAPESHPELRPHRVAVGLYRRSPDGTVERYARAEVDVDGPRTVVGDLVGADAPELVLVNDDDLTYCKIRFDENSLATLRDRLGDITDPLARALCWSALWNLTRDALMPARDFIDLVLRFAGRESDIGVLQMLHAWANSALRYYAAPSWREEGRQLLAEGALRELRLAEPGSQHQLTWARFFATVASSEADLQLLRGLLEGTAKIDGLEVDQELRWDFLEPLAAHGAADESVLAAELARDDTASGKRHQVRCLPPARRRRSRRRPGRPWWSPTPSPTPLSRRRSRASTSRPSGSCSRRTPRITSTPSSASGRNAPSRSAWTW